jgi:hypothetical protein
MTLLLLIRYLLLGGLAVAAAFGLWAVATNGE